MRSFSVPFFRSLAWVSLCLPALVCAQASAPWRLLPAHEHVDLRFSHLSRVEFLQGQYRQANNGSSDQAYIYRTTLEGRLSGDALALNVELLDARQALADAGTPLTRRSVDALNLQQLYMSWRLPVAASGAADVSVKLGRQAMNVGTRRLISRSTTNVPVSFTGITTDITLANDALWKAFAVAPVLNYPTARQDILANRMQADKESRGSRLFGLFTEQPQLIQGLRSEFYAIRLIEKDAGEEQVADLDITSVGAHLYRPAAREALDYDVELVLQAGKSRTSALPSDVQDLHHRAYFYHAALGYSFPARLLPYLQLLYDYASGDANPNDRANNGFDTLFGARRSEFGPSSLYGPFTRTNLSTLGLRLTLTPRQDLEMILTLRHFNLAQSRDGWGNTGWQDSSGRAGRQLGDHLETRLRWEAIPGNVALDSGLVWLSAGQFPREVSARQAPSMTRYAFLQTSLFF